MEIVYVLEPLLYTYTYIYIHIQTYTHTHINKYLQISHIIDVLNLAKHVTSDMSNDFYIFNDVT